MAEVNKAASPHEQFTRFYYCESTFSNWLTIACAILVLGTTVHLNVHAVVGATIFLLGTVALGWTLVMSFIWSLTGERNPLWIIRMRRLALVPMQLLLCAVFGLCTWALCLLYIDRGNNIL